MSKNLNLVLHAGGCAVDIERVYEVATPAPVGDHFPLAHNILIDTVKNHFAETGLRIIGEQHALAAGGQRYFGLMQIQGDSPDYDLVVGLRNTHDRSYAAGFCVGSGVFVCDNLAFSSEVKLARKHTRYIERDLPKLVSRGVAALVDHRKQQDQRLLAYKNTELGDKEAYATVIKLLKARAIVGQDVQKVVAQWDNPTYEDFAQDRNVWRLFNAVTTAAKPGLAAVVGRTQALHGVCDALALWKKDAIDVVPERIVEGVEDAEVQLELAA